MNKQTLLTSDWSQFRNSASEQTSDWWNRTWRASCCAAIGSSCCCSASFGLWEPQSLDRWMRAPPPEGTMSLHYTDTTMTSLTVWMNVWCGGCRWDQVTMSDTEVRWGEVRRGEVRWGEVRNLMKCLRFNAAPMTSSAAQHDDKQTVGDTLTSVTSQRRSLAQNFIKQFSVSYRNIFFLHVQTENEVSSRVNLTDCVCSLLTTREIHKVY